MFSWIPMYEELAQVILGYRTRQKELIRILKDIGEKGLPVIRTTDQKPKGTEIEMFEIDPFTFYASFNRGSTDANRVQIAERIKERLGLKSAVPTDWDGIPIVNAQASWFFGWAYVRQDDDIDKLWDLAEVVAGGDREIALALEITVRQARICYHRAVARLRHMIARVPEDM